MAATKEKDLYQILGVKEDAAADEIKRAYRNLAKKYHPDRTGGDKAKEQRFKEVSAANEVLSDPKKRQQYDAMRRGGFSVGPEGAPDFSAFAGIEGIEELLAQMFRGGPGGGGGAGGRRGRVVYESRPFSGFESFGFGGGDPFEGTAGGRRPSAPLSESTVRTADGVELTQRGDHTYGELELAVDEAVLGTKVPVSTPDGRLTLTIPPGTSSGRKLRLRGKGPHGVSGRGDHYVTVKIVVPENIDKGAEELIREFAKRAPVRLRR